MTDDNAGDTWADPADQANVSRLTPSEAGFVDTGGGGTDDVAAESGAATVVSASFVQSTEQSLEGLDEASPAEQADALDDVHAELTAALDADPASSGNADEEPGW